MSGLEFEVVPESCLRNENLELLLGTPINQVISALQNASRNAKKIELVYCNKAPFERDITITLKNDGIRLYFEAKTQLLKLIEVFDFKNVTLHYCNTVFSSPTNEANVNKIETCFGATHPGVYDEKQKMYYLHWRGVSFCFPAREPSTIQTSYAHGLGSLNFSNSSLPLLEKMTIFSGNFPDKMRIPEVPVSILCGNIHPVSIESINDNGKVIGLHIIFLTEDPSGDHKKLSELTQVERNVGFGDSEESVICALGSPSKIYFKSDDKMLIQKGTNSQNLRSSQDKPDFFFNYFTLGLDILFDFDTRRVIKFVLHTNIPGHFDFGIYNRAKFSIIAEFQPGKIQPIEPFASSTSIVVKTESKLEQLRDIFINDANEDGEIACKPVILNKSTFDGENPFGSSFCYGTDQMIVEVMDNSHIASVTIIKPNLA